MVWGEHDMQIILYYIYNYLDHSANNNNNVLVCNIILLTPQGTKRLVDTELAHGSRHRNLRLSHEPPLSYPTEDKRQSRISKRVKRFEFLKYTLHMFCYGCLCKSHCTTKNVADMQNQKKIDNFSLLHPVRIGKFVGANDEYEMSSDKIFKFLFFIKHPTDIELQKTGYES